MELPKPSAAPAPATTSPAVPPADVVVDESEAALVAELTQGLNALAAQLQSDRESLRASTQRVVAMEKELARFQALTQQPPQQQADRRAPATQAQTHVCGPGCQHYRFHDATSTADRVARGLAARHEAPLDGSSDAPLDPDAQAEPTQAADAGTVASPKEDGSPRSRADPWPATTTRSVPRHGAEFALSWFEAMLDVVPAHGLPSLVDHYAGLGWIDGATHSWMRRLAEGIAPGAGAAPLEAFLPDPAARVRLHKSNLVLLQRFRASDLSPDTVHRLEEDLERLLGRLPGDG